MALDPAVGPKEISEPASSYSASELCSDSVAAAAGAVATGAAMAFGGLAIAAATHGATTILGLALAFSGIAATILATQYLVNCSYIYVLVRTAYVIIAIALSVGTSAVAAEIILEMASKQPAHLADQRGQAPSKGGPPQGNNTVRLRARRASGPPARSTIPSQRRRRKGAVR